MWRIPFLALLISLSVDARSLNVIVDPGHGGSDTGATRGSYRESEIVLNISTHLVNLLSQSREFAVHTTRSNDHLVSLEDRTSIAESKKADVFISVHANSAPLTSTRGVEIYFQNQMPADVESLYLANRENEGVKQSKGAKPKGDLAAILDDLHRQNQIYLSSKLAQEVHRAWSKRQKSHLHIRQAPFHVLAEVTIPSILVETGFITNYHDSKQLADPTYQKEVARIIYEGLQSYRQRWLTTL